jgi:hypothetical protein
MALTLSGTNGVVGAGFSINPVGAVAGIATFSAAKVGGGVTISESGIEASGIGITCASINGGQIGGRRNLIINGAMLVAQRTNSKATVTTGATYDACDRFKRNIDLPTGVSNLTASQESDAPTGFTKSNKYTPNQARSGDLSGADRLFVQQNIEAQIIANSGWNYTDPNSSLMLSFYIKSNLTGVVSLEMNSQDSPTAKQHFRSTVTINSANTWERKSVKITGDSQLVFDDNFDSGMQVSWHYAAGPSFTSGTHVTGQWDTTAVAANRSSASNIDIFSSASNYVSLTGVQLEVGDQVTPFEHLTFGEELRQCQRYFCKTYNYATAPGTDSNSDASAKQGGIFTYRQRDNNYTSFSFTHPVEMRAVPTLSTYSHDGTVGKFTNSTTNMTSSTNTPLNGTHVSMAYGTSTAADDSYCHFVLDADI